MKLLGFGGLPYLTRKAPYLAQVPRTQTGVSDEMFYQKP